MKTRKLFYRVLTVVILCAVLLPWGGGSRTAQAACPVTAENWHEVGADSACAGGISNNSGRSWYSSLAIAQDGSPYVAWDDNSGGSTDIYVRRWSGSSWVEVGAGSASGGGISISNSGSSGLSSLAIAPDGTPYVAWDYSGDEDEEIYVRRWNGSSWEEVGAGSASGGGISNNSGDSAWPSAAVAPDGTPYVAWHDSSSGDWEIYARRWNGSSWEEVGAGSASGGGISNSSEAAWPSMAVAPDGTPYVAWEDWSSGDEIYVRRWNGSSWVEVGAGSASGGGISNNSGISEVPSVAVAPDGTLYVAWDDNSGGDYEIYVRRWNGSSWEEVGAGSASGGGISDNSGSSAWPSMAVAPDGTPYVAWHDNSGGDWEIYMRRWGGSGATYSISGRVTDGSNNSISGVTVTDGVGHTATTNSNGNYTLSGLTAGTYTITPSKSGYTFSPYSRIVSVPPSKTGQDFVAMPPPPSCTVPFFSQRDDRWKNHPLRTNGACSPTCSTIGACGCTLTSSAMVFAYYGANLNPSNLSDCMGTSACPFSWSAGASCTNGKATWVNRYGFSWSRLDQELNQNNRPVILGMHRKGNSSLTHWVLVVSGQGSAPANYSMHDPWFLGGANMKLSTRTQDYDLDWLAVYNGQPVCGTATSATLSPGAIKPQPALFTADSPSQSTQLTISEGNGLASSSIVSGTALIYSMTEVTMTVQLVAQSSAGNVTEMLIWTDSMTNTTWQPFTSLVWLPVSDSVYARFRDEFDNVSEVQSDTIHPVASPPNRPFEVFLPLIIKQ